MDENSLEKFLEIFYQFKQESKDKYFGFDDSWDIFIKKMLFLSPKSIGSKIQNRIIKENNFISVKTSEEKGDCQIDNIYYEIKTTIINLTNIDANITGLRKWHEIDYYIILIINATDYKQITTYLFKLSKEQMEEEMSILKASPLNGTKKSNMNNDKIAYRFGLKLSSSHFDRWKKEYLTDQIKL